MHVANAKNLREWFSDLEPSDARALANVLLDAKTPAQVDAAFEYANTLLGAHGVEGIASPGYEVDRYYGEIVGVYLNTGDIYNPTIIYEPEKHRFYVTTYADWYDARANRYHLE